MDHKNLKADRKPYLIKITEPQTQPEESEDISFNDKEFESIQSDLNFSKYSEERENIKALERKANSAECIERKSKTVQTLSLPFSNTDCKGNINTNNRKLKLDPKLQKAINIRSPKKVIDSSCSCLVF
ncbi:hypothetical protein SteCoe_14041 [Stentor coeruleus]|uniref:Uncharacterized protein n=1 Tax=Stentor coeruleus TaxID=5963 RepID=A0A1R2C702_9CILI|nr:hypothetical protein SteCoe_14041 [Stentor coeruleus]